MWTFKADYTVIWIDKKSYLLGFFNTINSHDLVPGLGFVKPGLCGSGWKMQICTLIHTNLASQISGLLSTQAPWLSWIKKFPCHPTDGSGTPWEGRRNGWLTSGTEVQLSTRKFRTLKGSSDQVATVIISYCDICVTSLFRAKIVTIIL